MFGLIYSLSTYVYQIDIPSVIVIFTIMDFALIIFSFLLLSYYDKKDAYALLILITADIALTFYRCLSLTQYGWSLQSWLPNDSSTISREFWLPMLLSLSFLLGLAAILKLRRVELCRPKFLFILAGTVLLSVLVGIAVRATSPAIHALLLPAVISLVCLLSCISLWPLTKQYRAGNLLFGILLWQLLYTSSPFIFMLIDSGYAFPAYTSAFFILLAITSHLVTEIGKTLAFIVLLNERQYVFLKVKNDDLDKRISESIKALQFKNQLLERENIHRAKIEADLRAQQDSFLSLTENIPDNILRQDLSGRLIYANQQMRNMLGLSSPKIVGYLPSEIPNIAQSPNFELYSKLIKEVVAHGTSREAEIVMSLPDGETQIHHLKIVPEFDIRGDLKSTLTLCRDITQLKKNEQIIRDRAREFYTLADNFPYILVRYDISLRRVYINQRYLEVSELKFEELFNKSIDEVWSINKRISAADFKRYLERVIQRKQPENFFLSWQVSSGELFYQEMYLVPEFDETGTVVSILGIGHENNMFKKAIMELGELNAELEQLSAKREAGREADRKHMAQEIHDDLGQLISLLRLHARMIEYEHGADNPDLRTKAHKIIQVADRAIDSVKNLVSQLRPVMFDRGLIYAIEDLAEDFYSNTSIACLLEMSQKDVLHQQLSEMEESRALVIFRTVQEALTNVMRHSKASKVLINVFSDSSYLSLRVIDNGIGFNPHAVDMDNSFGLVSMRERMNVLHGELEIISEQDIGTEVRLRIPIDIKKKLIK